MINQSVIGRSRTGDQLHLCSYLDYQQEGRKPFISSNSHCNQRMHLRPLSGFRTTEKVDVKLRPGLLCVKCFGSDPAHAATRDYYNANIICT